MKPDEVVTSDHRADSRVGLLHELLEQTARGLEGPGEIAGGSVGKALRDWATRIEAILTEPRADEPIP